MKKQVLLFLKNVFIFLLFSSLLIFCERDKDKGRGTPDNPVENVLIIHQAQVLPQEIALLSGDDLKFSEDQYVAEIDDEVIDLIRLNDSTLYCVVPELPVGTHKAICYISGDIFGVAFDVNQPTPIANPDQETRSFIGNHSLQYAKFEEAVSQLASKSALDKTRDLADLRYPTTELDNYLTLFVGSSSEKQVETLHYLRANAQTYNEIEELVTRILLETRDLSFSTSFGKTKRYQLKEACKYYKQAIELLLAEEKMLHIMSELHNMPANELGFGIIKACWRKMWKELGIIGTAIAAQTFIPADAQLTYKERQKVIQNGEYEIVDFKINVRNIIQEDDVNTSVVWLKSFIDSFDKYIAYWNSHLTTKYQRAPAYSTAQNNTNYVDNLEVLTLTVDNSEITGRIDGNPKNILAYFESNATVNQDFKFKLTYSDGDFSVESSALSATLKLDCAPIDISTNVTNIECAGDQNGSIEINATGGKGTLQYSIDDGITFVSTNEFGGLTGGEYQVVVKDADNCKHRTTPVTVSEPQNLEMETSFSHVTEYGSNDGYIEIEATGGTAPYQYSINSGEDYFSTSKFENLTTLTYYTAVQDANGCIVHGERITLRSCQKISLQVDSEGVSSLGQNDGRIFAFASGGIGTLQFSIDGGETFTSQNTFEDLPPGEYEVIVRDLENCTKSRTVVVEDGKYAVIHDERDGNVYNAIRVGEQWWMAENLRFNNSGSSCYENEPENCEKYGRLYTWYSAINNACPAGWHVPGDADWKEFELNLGVAEEVLDDEGYRGDNHAVNKILPDGSTEFDLIWSGSHISDSYIYLNKAAFFWTSTEVANQNTAWFRSLRTEQNGINRARYSKEYSFSVRCIKDKE